MTDWKDIASAPKDGTKVDLLFPYPRGRTIDCYWADAPYNNWVWKTPTWGDVDLSADPMKFNTLLPEDRWSVHMYPNMEPTHWMLPPPSPAAPKEGE